MGDILLISSNKRTLSLDTILKLPTHDEKIYWEQAASIGWYDYSNCSDNI